jgi:mRNA interferase YafQ
MRYEVVTTKRFKTAYKKVKQLPGFKEAVFKEVVATLAAGEVLPSTYKDHKLSGNLKDFRECHFAPDILLIYQLDEGVLILTLVCLGSHAQLFR